MKKLAISGLLAVGMFAFAFSPGHSEEKAAPQTLQGEILDMSCYMTQGASGKGHMQCAKTCLKGGSSMGLLMSDGSVYLVMDDHKNDKAYEAAKKMAGEQVKMTGVVYKRGGISTIAVEKVEKAS